MITKKWKMIFLGIFAIMLVSLPSLNGSEGTGLTSVTEDRVNNQNPEISAIDDPKNLVLTNAGNYGLKMNASSIYEDKVYTPSSWTYDGTSRYNTYTNAKWRVPFPVDLVSANAENIDYRLTSGTISVTGLTDDSNFIPIPGDDSQNFYPVGWDPISTSNSQFVDNYYGTSTSHINRTTQSISASTETSTASGWDIDGSTDFDNANSAVAGYVALNAARRNQVFSSLATANSSTYTPTNLAADSGATGSTLPTSTTTGNTAWGSGGTVGAGQEGYNMIYSANYQPDNTASIQTWSSATSGWAYGDTQNNLISRSPGEINTATEEYTTSLSRKHYVSLYSSHGTTQTGNTASSWVRAKYFVTDWYTTEYTMSFYYKDDSLDTPDIGSYSFNIDADQLGVSTLAFSTAGSAGTLTNNGDATITATGKVTSYITKDSPTGSHIAEVNTDITTSSLTPVSKTDKADMFSGSGTYYLHIRVYLQILTNIDRSLVAVSGVSNDEQLQTGTAKLVCSTSTYNGISCKISTPRVIIAESVNMVQSGEHTPLLLKSKTILWDQRNVISGATMVFRVGYQISNYIKGTDESVSGLEYGFFSVKFTIKKTGVPIDKIFQYNMSSSISTLISGSNKIGEFKVNMTGANDYLDFKSSLNKADSLIMEVGLILKPGFQMSYSQSNLANSRVYFNNVEFRAVTRPTATFLGLELGYQNDDTVSRYYYPIVDDASGTTSSVTLIGGTNANFTDGGVNDLSDEMWNDVDDYFFFRAKNNSLAFTYTASFTVEVFDWNRNYTITFAQDKTYYTIDTNIATPKPASAPKSTTVAWDSRFKSYWQDNFNVFLIVPKYEYGGGHIWWNLTTGTYMNIPGRSPETYNGYNSTVGLKSTEILRESNPVANMYGSSVNNGKIQVVYLFNRLFNTYTYQNFSSGPVTNGVDSMNWVFQFEAPNEVGNIIVDHNTSFDFADSKKFYISTSTNETVYVQASTKTPGTSQYNYTANILWQTPTQVTRKTVNFTWQSGIPGYNSVSNSFIVGKNNLGQDNPADLAERGPNWLAYGQFYLNDRVGVHRIFNTNTEQFIGGAYRGGMNYTTFTVVSAASVSIKDVTNCNFITSVGDNSSTYLFDSTTHVLELENNPLNMINLSIVWKDFDLSPVIYNSIDTSVTITLSSYLKPDAFMKYVPSLDYENHPMVSAGNGVFWLNFDPMNMDERMDTAGRHGNLTRGYHNYTITLAKTGMDTYYFTGNFSVKVDTLLEITNPSHEIFFGSKEYAHYDANSLLTLENYTLTAEYRINSTSTTKELISNEAGSPYAPYVFMKYNLTAVYTYNGLVNNQPPISYTSFVNEPYFVTNYGADPYSGRGWPSKGIMSNTAGDGAFRASFSWPKFELTEYNENAPAYALQLNDPCVLVYNISVYCAVNRSYDYRYTWQMHDVESQACEGLVTNGTGYTNLVKVKEEVVLLRLNSNSNGNYSRVILTNNVAEDLNPFELQGSIFDPDLDNVENFAGLFSPQYKIRNYQDRIGTEYFRLRVLLNCTKSKTAMGIGEEQKYKSGYWPEDQITYPMGPLNDTTYLYGLNQTWTSNTTIKLFDWNATTLYLEPDYTHLWSCWVNGSGASQFPAYGITYVSPWLRWADRDVGNSTIRIQAIKDGFISTPQSILVEVIPTPTRLFNGSKSNPDFNADIISATEETSLNLTTSTGKSISFLLNYTDITNYNATNPEKSVIRPIAGATMRCMFDEDPYIWQNGTGSGGTRSSWKFEYLGNGVYNITIIKINVDVASNYGNIWTFKFQFEKLNYETQEFLLNLNVTKRVSKFYNTQPIRASDYYYYFSTGEGAMYNWTHPLNVTNLYVQFKVGDEENGSRNIQVPNYNLLTNSKIVLTYRLSSQSASADKLLDLGDEFTINENLSTGLACYDVNLTNSFDTGPGIYTITVNLFNVDNYYDSSLQFNVTILEAPAKLELISSSSTRGYFPLLENKTTEEKYMPQYILRYSDGLRNNSLNEPVQFSYRTTELGFGGFTATSNFTNTYRTLSTAYSGEDNGNRMNPDGTGIKIDNLLRATTVSGKPSIYFIFDIFGLDVLSDSQGNYLPRTVELNITWKYYQTKTIKLDFTIINATTRLWYEDSWNSTQTNEVMVKTYETDSEELLKYNTIGEIYQSKDGTVVYPMNIPWGYAVQVQFCYRAFGIEKKTPIQDNSQNDYFFVYSGSYAGISDYKTYIANDSVVAGLSSSLRYSIFQFTASPSNIPVVVKYDFSIWKKNYNPINYTVQFSIVSRQTRCEVNAMPDRPGVSNVPFQQISPQYDYSQTISWVWNYIDGRSNEDIEHNETKLYINNGETLLEQGRDNAKDYKFDSGLTAKIWFYIDSASNYVIKIDTQTLLARSESYLVNMTFTAPFYDAQPLLWKDSKTGDTLMPKFKITPVQLKVKLWLFNDIKRNPDTELGERTSVQYSYNQSKLDTTRVYIYVKTYATLYDDDNHLYEETIYDNITVTIILNDLTKYNEEDEPTFLASFNMSRTTMFYEVMKLQVPGKLIAEELPSSTQVVVEVTSSNPNFLPTFTTGEISILVGDTTIPPYFWIIIFVSIGSMVGIGMYGIRKALLLRIPFVLRMIDESIEKISKDKFPTVGVMLGRNEYVINKVIDFLDECGIEWSVSDKIEHTAVGEEEDGESGSDSAESKGPMGLDEITVELNKISTLTPDEREMFIDELKRLDRKGQDEFLKSLREDSGDKK